MLSPSAILPARSRWLRSRATPVTALIVAIAAMTPPRNGYSLAQSVFRETLLYRGGVVSSFFITVRSLSYSYRTLSREVLPALGGRRDGRHMMGSEGEAEQSETRPAEAEPCFPANVPRPSSP